MKVLVTGGGGFLGRYLVQALIDRGDDVRVLGRQAYPQLEKLGVEILRGDLSDSDAVAAACSGVEAVIHVAAKVGLWGRWKDFYRVNVLGTRNVIDGCLKQGVQRLVYTSTPSVAFAGKDLNNASEESNYPSRYSSYYPASKAIAERSVLGANGSDWVSGAGKLYTVSLRPHLIWGPGDNHLIPSILERGRQGKLVIVGKGDNVVDFTYVENVVSAHLKALDSLSAESPAAGKAYFISQDEPVNLWEFVGDLLDRFGIPRPQRKLSYPAAAAIGAFLEGVYRVLPLKGEPRMTRFLAAQLAYSHHFSIENAKRDFGYEPLVSMEEGMRRFTRAML